MVELKGSLISIGSWMKSTLISEINKARRTLGQNIALDDAERTGVFKSWVIRIQQVLQQQARISPDLIDKASILVVKNRDANPLIVALLIKEWFDFLETFNSWDGMKLLGFYLWAANTGGSAAHEKMETGNASKFVLSNQEIIGRIQRRAEQAIKAIDDTTREQIAKYIEDGTRGLLTSDEIADMINEKYKDISLSRAQMIAQTELAFTENATEYETYARSGVKRLRWVTVMDDRVSQRDQAMHGQERALGQDFTSSFDGWSGPMPPSHPRCRCFLEEVIQSIGDSKNRTGWLGA